MPKRMIDDSLFSSPSLARCSPRAQDALHRFVLLMDDFGCAEANPRVLLGRGWPLRTDVTESDVWGWLEEYVAAGMACLWAEKDRRWVYLTGWHGPHGQKHRHEYDERHPKGSKRRTPVPPPELVAAVLAGARRDSDGRPPGTDVFPDPGNSREDDPETPSDSVPARDGAGKTAFPGNFPGSAVPVAVAVPDAGTTCGEAQGPAVVAFDCVGTGAKVHGVTEAQVAEYRQAFPGVDVVGELRRMRLWLEAHPDRRKTARGMPRFITSWLTRSQDRSQGLSLPARTHGDLGVELRPWWTRLTHEERHQVRQELAALHPDFADPMTPIGADGVPGVHPVEEIAAVNDKWRKVADART